MSEPITMSGDEVSEVLGRLSNAAGGLRLALHSGAFDERDDFAAVLTMAREQIEEAHAAIDRAGLRR